MIVALSDHRMDEGDVVGAGRKIRQQIADPESALTPALKAPRAFHKIAGLAKKRIVFAFSSKRLAMIFLKIRLMIERIDVAHATGGEDVHHSLGFRPKVRWFG